MGLYSSFYSSLSGLSANANALTVIGNNLANLNTVGFKGSSASFEDLFNAAIGGRGTEGNGDPMQIGMGTSLGGIDQNFAQGSFQATGSVTDMALQGEGFFCLQTKDGQHLYTRAGNFTTDHDGYLVTPNGDKVLGWNRVGGSLVTSGITSPVRVDMGTTSLPSATSSIGTTTNLNSAAATGDVYSTPVQIYDSLGGSHSLVFTYTKTANPGEWGLNITTDGGATVSGYPATIQFNSSGQLTSPAANPSLTIAGWTTGATSPATTWQIYSGGTSSLTGFAAPSSTNATSQNGFASGTIRSLSVDQNGRIIGNFTNGQTIPMAQVSIALFNNVEGLSKTGNNSWSDTLSSGGPAVGAANEGGRGTVLGSNLELSNVDVAEEFTRLIINQRGYQANSRVVTTADSLLQETLNLLR
jgi:flagellar hook protein FlgE